MLLLGILQVNTVLGQQQTGRSLLMLSGDNHFLQDEGGGDFQYNYVYSANYLYQFNERWAGGMYLGMNFASSRQIFTQAQSINFHIEPQLRYYLGEKKNRKFYLQAGAHLKEIELSVPAFSSIAPEEVLARGGSFTIGAALPFKRTFLLDLSTAYQYQVQESEMGNSLQRYIGFKAGTGLIYHPARSKYQKPASADMLRLGVILLRGDMSLSFSPDDLNQFSYDMTTGIFLSPRLAVGVQTTGIRTQALEDAIVALVMQRELGVFLRRYFPVRDYLQVYSTLGLGREISEVEITTNANARTQRDQNGFLRLGIGGNFFISRHTALDISLAASFSDRTQRHRIFRVGVMHFLFK